jgi:hypothetical protein
VNRSQRLRSLEMPAIRLAGEEPIARTALILFGVRYRAGAFIPEEVLDAAANREALLRNRMIGFAPRPKVTAEPAGESTAASTTTASTSKPKVSRKAERRRKQKRLWAAAARARAKAAKASTPPTPPTEDTH